MRMRPDRRRYNRPVAEESTIEPVMYLHNALRGLCHKRGYRYGEVAKKIGVRKMTALGYFLPTQMNVERGLSSEKVLRVLNALDAKLVIIDNDGTQIELIPYNPHKSYERLPKALRREVLWLPDD